MSRREWLRIGGLAGLTWPAWQSLRSAAAATAPRWPGFGQARSVILVFASGGQSQLDTWDPKPEAPAEIRGEFSAIRTSVPGTLLCEHMPRLARLADRYTIVRSMSHDDLDHGSASYLALTGRFHRKKSSNPPPSPEDEPTYGAILRKLRPNRRFPYDAVHINGPAQVPVAVAPGQNAGFLGRKYEPLLLGDVSQTQVVLPELTPQPELPPVRLSARQALKETVDRYAATLPQTELQRDLDQLYAQAFELLSRPEARQAFDLGLEPERLRRRYGLHRSGQACLLARRLVEAGVPLITVIWNHTNRGQDSSPDEPDSYGWDTHNDIFDSLRTHLLPRFDESFSALLEDLDQRGLLDQTLVVCLGEFGRAPLVALEKKFAGSSPGRKHWANVYSIVMAGAGVKRGGVVGASDRLGGAPISPRISPADVAATIFSALGVDPHGHYRDDLGRPLPIAAGRPIAELYEG